MRSAVIHVAGDCVQSVGVGVAAVIIWLRPAWRIADPISTFVFAALVLFTTWRLVVDLIDIVIEPIPHSFDLESLTAAMRCIPAVDDIHDIHIWALKPGMLILAMHLTIEESGDCDEALRAVTALCKSHGISHTTVQVSSWGGVCPCKVAEG